MQYNWLRRLSGFFLSSTTVRGWSAAPFRPVFSLPTSEPGAQCDDVPCVVSEPPPGDDADIANAWLALETMTDVALTRDEVEAALFVEAKHGCLFGSELAALCALRRNYHTPFHPSATFHSDDEREVQS